MRDPIYFKPMAYLQPLSHSLSLLLLFFSSLFDSDASANPTLFSDDFEKADDSVIYRYLKGHGHDAVVVPSKGVNGSKGLEVTYVSIYKGSGRVKGFFPLSKKTNEASLSYDVKFSEDFQFVLGGKMHGLGPDEVVTGDWKVRPDGWSSRIMWRQEGKIETVLCLQDQRDKWGEYKSNEHFRFKREKYYAVTLYTRLNTAYDKKDGEVKVYVDGQLLIKYDNAYFWKDPVKDARISQFLFSTFHGGGDAKWAPKDKNGNFINVHATFDNFIVHEGLRIREKPGQQ